MLSPFKNFFHYSKSERNGSLILLLLFAGLIIVFGLINWWPTVKDNSNNNYSAEIKEFNEALAQSKSEPSSTADSLFLFNPNTIGVKEWQLLGFSEKQAQSIEKYKSKGAQFYCKEDIKKLFVVDEDKYNELVFFIDLPDCQSKSSKFFNYEKDKSSFTKDSACVVIFLTDSTVPLYKPFKLMKNVFSRKREGVFSYYQTGFSSEKEAQLSIDLNKFPKSKVITLTDCNKLYPVVVYPDKEPKNQNVQVVLNLNTADSIELLKIKGIWPALAGRIVKYRKQLGGFLAVEQLKEVYGITDTLYLQFKPNITITTISIQKININTASINELKMHPYIDYKVANSIFLIRKNHGMYKKVEDIKKSDLINDELFSKIAPYLKTE
jgi:competence ComEA-like helix-hairpin-helix protein